MDRNTTLHRGVVSSSFGIAAVLLLGALSACTYRGQIDRPFTQKATWFSYLNGDDIRARCQPGSGFEYRLIYNGRYDEQIRSYEMVDDGAGGARLTARVQEGIGIDVTKLSVTNPLKKNAWTKAERVLTTDERIQFEKALEASGAGRATSEGLRLFSGEFYWLANICHDGVFVFNAWRYPSDRYGELKFPELLLAMDETGVAFNPPRFIPAAERIQANDSHPDRREYNTTFNVEVGENGLKGAAGKI
ncbi:hypothetical protein [Denitrobaculum tricleocarpae]|uniref:Uncharacterized protein n=1 Tax=Denitrobaculum tricleocarpae TaxID=2591009 RepID=A0A545TY10_9PROT|nr:hypothetical protein [Denitrobaculum tricleocarpae]TQV82071.1 hypothetical protein FKG95_07520 [Denitrobaculum tricleocarpae]